MLILHHLLTLTFVPMKCLKSVAVIISFIVISSIYSCGGGNNKETAKDSTTVSKDQVIEQTVDSTLLTNDTLKNK